MADGGVCCIDEFNIIPKTIQTALHEAMEQQTVSITKAGIICKLKTRCTILAAANPKTQKSKKAHPIDDIGNESPLLSRFDLVFLLHDERVPEWDDAIADHLLAQVTTGFSEVAIDCN